MERREFVRLGFLAAIASVVGIEVVQEAFTISNRPHPSSVFTEESLRKTLEEFERISRYKEKMYYHHYRYRLSVSDWRGFVGYND